MYFIKVMKDKFLFQLLKLRLSIAFILALFVVLFSTTVIFLIEPETFESFSEALWLVSTTVYTVGYGDISPKTELGRMFTAFFIYPIGIGTFTMLVSKIFESIITASRRKERGKLKFEASNHYVLFGAPDSAKQTIDEILKVEKNAKFVFVDDADTCPINRYEVHYISGDATDENTLEMANVLNSKRIIILSDTNNKYSDAQNLIVASAIEAYSSAHNKNVQTIVEISEEKHEKLFAHAKCEVIICTKKLVSTTIANAALLSGK